MSMADILDTVSCNASDWVSYLVDVQEVYEECHGELADGLVIEILEDLRSKLENIETLSTEAFSIINDLEGRGVL